MRALVLMAALLAAAPAVGRDGVVRFEWAPNPEPDVAYYLVERAGSTEWVEVARVKATPDAPEFNPARGVFTFDSPVSADPGRWRLTAVDVNGNAGRPVHLQPAPGAVEEEQRPRASCEWALPDCRVPVVCERACACDVVSRRLDSAREDLRAAGVMERPELLDQGLCLSAIYLVGPERLVTPDGVQAAGAAAEGAILLATDMRAAAHEMFHLYLYARGDRTSRAQQHEAWERDPRLKDIDKRAKVGGWR